MSWLSCIVSNIVLALVVALAAWFVQQRLERYAVARILWVLALVKLVTPPFVSVQLVELPGTMACALGACQCGQHAGTLATMSGTLPWVLLAVWSAGAGTICWTAWQRWSRFQRLIAHARPAPPEWQLTAARLVGELSIHNSPEILTVPGRLPPMVVPGWRRPRMLLPVTLMGKLNTSQKEALLLHELLHVKRGDHLIRMLELVVSVVFWWLPIVGSIGRQLRSCEEACCDAAVVARLPQARRDYARLLLDVLDFAVPLPPPAVSHATAISPADLEKRLLAIIEGGHKTRHTWPVATLVMSLACVIMPCELRYDFALSNRAGEPAPTTNLDWCEPAAATTTFPGGDDEGAAFSAYCCPS
jgi:beta-lactamase regulating signal transducer with metallopeptidase domain